MPEETNQDPAVPESAGPAPDSEPGQACGNCGGCPLHGGQPSAPETAGGEVAPGAEPTPEAAQAQAQDAAPAAAHPARKPRLGWVATAHLGKMSRLEYLSAPGERGLEPGRKVVVRTDRGTEMGTIVFGPRELDLNELPRATLPVVRAATEQDLAHQKHIEDELEPAEFDDCKQTIALHRLPMKLAEVEHIFGGEKLIFYFMADGRVDFRALVRDMARKHRARIDFRQIGVRDEARLLAEYEHCGRPLCCRQFLRGLEPVTMRMAKLQKATLDPAKISGRCGRLMCCLRFEDETYAYLRSQLPGRGAYVLTEELAGQVLSGEVVSQKVTVGTTDNRRVVISVKDIKQVSDKPLAAPERKYPISEPSAAQPSAARPPASGQGPGGGRPRQGGDFRRARQGGTPRQPGQGRPPQEQRQGPGPGQGQSARPPQRQQGQTQSQPRAPQQSGQGQGQGAGQGSGQGPGQGRGRRHGGRRRRPGGGAGRGPGPQQGQGPGPGQNRAPSPGQGGEGGAPQA